MIGPLATAVSALAAPPTPPPGEGPEWGKAAPIGLLIILLLCGAVWLLLRSMNKHLRKVQRAAEAEQTAREAAREAAPEAGQTRAEANVAARHDADAGEAGPADDDTASPPAAPTT